jgi:hypothetical protein
MLREHRPGVAVVKPTFIDGGPDTQHQPTREYSIGLRKRS